MTMDLYTSVLDKKKVDDMKLLENTIGLGQQNKKIIQFGAWEMVSKWCQRKNYGVKYLEKYRKINILRGEKSMTFDNYYVYQSTPFDLYGTPDFSEI